MSDPPPLEELEDLVAECAGRVEVEGAVALEQLCRDHPQHAPALRRAIEQLARFGVVGAAAPGPDRAPEQLGDFEIRGEIGRGGMGIVYEARQRSLDRVVALKVLPAAWVLDPRQVQRFRNEAHAAATLDHPHIVPVYGVGAEGQVHYYAMQLIHGVSVSRVLQWLRSEGEPADPRTESVVNGLFPPGQKRAADLARGVELSTSRETTGASALARTRRMADLVLQAADALEAAHRVGVLHRDVKPGNLLVDSRGHLWVTDFGLAHVAEGGASLTRSGEFLGTLCYSSPEQIDGRTAVDARSDVYGLGAALYEMLTLRAPFTGGDPVALLRRVATEEPTPPRAIDPRLPRDLETIVQKAMAKEPAQRYQTAAALADDLRAFQGGRPIVARPVTRLERGWRWCRRNRVLASAICGLSLLTLVAAAVGYFALRVTTERNRALRAESELTRLSSRRRIESNRAAAEALRRSLFAGRRFDSLRLLREVVEEIPAAASSAADAAELRVQLRSDVVASLSLWDATQERLATAEQVRPLAFDSALARHVGRRGQDLVVCDAGGHELARLPDAGVADWARFDPGGEWIAFVVANNTVLRAWHWRSGRVMAVPGKLCDGRAFSFTDDGAGLVAAVDDNRILAGVLATGAWTDVLGVRARERLASEPGADCLSVRPDGRGLAIAPSQQARVLCVDLDADRVQCIEMPDHVHALSWERDSRHLVAAGRFMDVLRLDAEHGAIVGTWRGHSGAVLSLARTARGDLLASGWYDGQVRLWSANGEARLVLPAAGEVMNLAFTADGSGLGWEREFNAEGRFAEARRWRLHAPAAMRAFEVGHLKSGLLLVAFCPTAPLLAQAMYDCVVLLHAGSGELLGVIPCSAPRRVRFLDDGALFVATRDTGCSIYPLTRNDAGEVHVGPPRRLAAAGDLLEADADGDRVGVWDGRELRLVSRDDREIKRTAAAFHAGVWLRLAPRLPYAALGSWGGRGAIVWDLEGGSVATEVPAYHQSAFASFSPDGRHLVVSRRDAHWILEVGSWRRVHTIQRPALQTVPGVSCFSPDGRLLAAPSTRHRLLLLDARTFEALVELEPPDAEDPGNCDFSSDGTRLAMASSHRRVVVWDLRAMRAALRELGLDWSDEPIPPPPSAEPLRLVIER